MKKVRFFSDADITALQEKVNTWLSENKDAEVIETNLTSYSLQQKKGESAAIHNFYILYSIINQEAKEISAMMVENNPSIQMAEIKEDVLKPTN